MRRILPRAKRIRYCTPVRTQIFIITLWKDSRQRVSGSKKEQEKGGEKKEHEYVIERHFMNTSGSDLCKAKQMKGGQRKMEVYTVSCHGGQLKAHNCAGAHTHPVNPQVLSSRLQPSIPLLIFISASVMRTKESTQSLAHPSSLVAFSWSLQARPRGLISNCD